MKKCKVVSACMYVASPNVGCFLMLANKVNTSYFLLTRQNNSICFKKCRALIRPV